MPFFGVPIRNGLPIGLGSVAGFGVQQFDPSQLFAGGTAGAWYDPSDLTTLFTTSAGTTQCAMPGQGGAVSVGLMLDKSQGLVLGTNIQNGGFDTDTVWTKNGWVISGGTASYAGGAGAAIEQTSPVTLAAGDWVRVTVTISAITSGFVYAWVAGTNTSALGPLATRTSVAGTYTWYFPIATVVNQNVGIYCANGPSGVVIDNVSIQKVAGNHAIAANDSTARPELRARVNLLVATATLSTQSVTTQATSYTLRFAGTGSITLSGTATGSYSAGTHTITCTAGTLTLTVSGTVTTADLRPANSGALLPAYQAVVDANTYDTSGFPLYLRFDGIDDRMFTASNFPFTGDPTFTCFWSQNRQTTSSVGTFGWGSTSTALAAAGHFYVSGTNGLFAYAGANNFNFATDNANEPAVYSYAKTPGAINTTSSARRNGANNNGVGSSSNTPNISSTPLYIGAWGNLASNYFNGNIYSLIIAGSAVSAGNISATEQWVANKTGIVIP